MEQADLTVSTVLSTLGERAGRRPTPYSTRLEIADHLERDRTETDPLIDQAHAEGYIEEHPEYAENWKLTEAGQAILDSGLFR